MKALFKQRIGDAVRGAALRLHSRRHKGRK